MRLSTRSRLLFLVFVVLGVYYPVLFAGVNSVDDFNMMSSLSDQTHVDWFGVFLPSGGYYYRPLLLTTYIADKYLWDLTESFMHLENILLHAVNAVLVFLLAKKVLVREKDLQWELPLLSALLFALHPINTESVAWISGRTDPLASIFVLSSAIFLVKGLQEECYRHYVIATVLLLFGCLSKEIAVFFLPAACFVVLSYHKEGGNDDGGGWITPEKLKRVAILIAPFFLCGVAYVCLRFSSWTGGPASVSQILVGKNGSTLNTMRIVFKVFGFYVKKLFLPLPLNFAIFSADNRYVWVGCLATLLLILIARKRNLFSAFAVTAGILIVPAILVTLSHVAWTPLAERYLYLPSAFSAIALVGSLQLFGERHAREGWSQYLLVLLLVPATFFTAQRNITWQTNLALYQDTQKKSPESAIIKNELAIALAKNGQSAEANRQLEAAKKQDPQGKYALPYVNQANLKIAAGDLDGARALIQQVLKDEATSDPAALRILARIDEKRLFHKLGDRALKEVYREIAHTHDLLYEKTGNPVDLYRSAQMNLVLGDKERARALFEKAYQVAPDGTYFKPAALKLANKLKQ